MKKEEENFFDKVHAVARLIPKGKVTSYGAIAEYLGARISSRMTGWAMNAAPMDVPAHRVLNRNGMLTGKNHFATATLMQEMLEAEGHEIENDCVKNFKEKYWDPNTDIKKKSKK
jgi:methylated-DNA-protein-cysteine methyltransferase-like protein